MGGNATFSPAQSPADQRPAWRISAQDNTICKLFGQGSEQSSVFQARNSFGIHALDKDFTKVFKVSGWKDSTW
jgi:hypothetical protein